MKFTIQELLKTKGLKYKTLTFLKAHVLVVSVISILCVAICAAAAVQINKDSTTQVGRSSFSQPTMTNDQGTKTAKASAVAIRPVQSAEPQETSKAIGTGSAGSTVTKVSSPKTSRPVTETSPPKQNPSSSTAYPAPSISCTGGDVTQQDVGGYTTFTDKFTLVPNGDISGASLTYKIFVTESGFGGWGSNHTTAFNGQTSITMTYTINDSLMQMPDTNYPYIDFQVWITSNDPSVTGACGMEFSGENPYASPPFATPMGI